MCVHVGTCVWVSCGCVTVCAEGVCACLSGWGQQGPIKSPKSKLQNLVNALNGERKSGFAGNVENVTGKRHPSGEKQS